MADPILGETRRFVVPAVDPDTGRPDMEVQIPPHRLQWAKKIGIGAIYELGESVPAILVKPAAIYRGLMRDEDDDRGQCEGWLCYCGIPERRYDYRTAREIAIKRRVLLVYVNREHVMYHHRWEEEDERVSGIPADCENRYKERPI